MARIQINDLPEDHDISDEEMRAVFGGLRHLKIELPPGGFVGSPTRPSGPLHSRRLHRGNRRDPLASQSIPCNF